MKKFLSFSLTVCIFALSNMFAQVSSLSEDFSSGSIPDGWTTIHISGSSYWGGDIVWDIDEDAAFIEYSSSEPADNYLITPQISVQSNMMIEFEVKASYPDYAYGTDFTVEVSTTTAEADEFSVIYTVNLANCEYFTPVTIPLADYEGKDIYVAFHVVDDDGTDVYIDNVSIDVQSCPKPSNLVANMLQNDGTLTWDGDGTSYDVEYVIATDSWDNAESLSNQVSPVSINNLNSSTTYKFRVRNNCGNDMSAWVESSFKTACGTVTITEDAAFVENFSSVPDCWDLTQGSDNWTWSSYNNYLYHNYGTYNCKAVSPLFDLTAVETPYLKFQYSNPDYQSSGVGDHLNIYYRSAIEDEWAVLVSITTNHNSQIWDSIALPNPSETYQLMFEGVGQGNDGNGLNLYNVHVYNEANPAECTKAIAINVSEITTDQATVSWTQPDDATSWTVKYRAKTMNDDTDWSEENVSNEPTITLTGLNANTTYEVRIVTNCGDNELSYPSSDIITFKTLCGGDGLILTYVDGFESADPLSCYFKTKTYTSTYSGEIYPKEQTSSYSAHSGSKYIEFSGTDQILVLPAFNENVDLTEARIRFWMDRGYYTDYNMQVGVMTDPNDETTFESLATIYPADISNGWNEQIVSLTELTNNGKYIAFFFNSTNDYYGCYIDDITVELIPDCLKINGLLSCTNTDNESATIKFSDSEDQTLWILYYKKSNASNYTQVEIYDHEYTLTNLESSTEYQAYIIRPCESGNEFSETSNLITFKTTAVPYSLEENGGSYSMEFEDDATLTGWTLVGSSTNQWKIGSAVNNGGEQAMYISDDNGVSHHYSTNNTSNAYASFLVKFGNKAEYSLSFDFLSNGESSYWGTGANDYLSVFVCEGGYTLPTSGAPNGQTLLSYQVNKTEWENFTTVLDGVQNTTKQIVFYWYNNSYNGSQPPAAIDNFTIVGSDCGSANTLSVTEISETTATVTWNQPGENTVSWKVLYKTSGETQWQESEEINGEPTATLTDLNPSSIYEFKIETLCGEETHPVSSVATFHTSCGIIDLSAYQDGVWKQDFENLTSSSLEDLCFTLTKTATASNGTFPYVQDLIGQGSAHTGVDDGSYGPGHALECKGGDIILTLPRFNADISSLRFKFWYRQNGQSGQTGTCEIGVMSNPLDETTFESVQTLTSYPVPSVVNYYDYYLASVNFSETSYTGNDNYIAIKYTSADAGISWYWDDIEVGLAPECSGIDLNSVQVENIGSHSATVTFSDPDESHNSWNIYTKTADSDWILAGVANDKTYDLTDLDAETAYSVYVVTVCGNEEATDKSMAVNFTTTIACPAPTNVKIDNISQQTANLTWDCSSEVSSWVVTYKINNDDNDSQSITVNEKSFDLTDLQSGTKYTVTVASDCDNEGTSNYVEINFTTLCDAIAVTDNEAWEEDFDNESNANCWQLDNWSISNGNLQHDYSYNSSEAGSPIFDLSGVTNPYLIITHNQTEFYGATDILEIYGRTNSSEDWILLSEFGENETSTDTIQIQQPSTAYQLKFRYNAQNGDGVEIDYLKIFNKTDEPDTTVITPPCDKPTNLSVANKTYNSATITWNGNAESYEIQLSNNAVENTTATTKTFNNLTAAAQYTVKVRAKCSETEFSDWVSIDFTTDAEPVTECPKPTDLTVVSVEQTTAIISWEGDATSFDVQLNTGEIVNVTAKTYKFENLTEETTYMAKVRGNCGENNSDWASITFTTLPSSLADIENNLSIFTYPNPTTSNATLTLKGISQDAQIVVTDVAGKVVLTDMYKVGQANMTIHTENLPAGVYYVRIMNENINRTQQLIKQ